MKRFLLINLFFLNICLNSFSNSSEDLEIENLKNQINLMQTKLKELEHKKAIKEKNKIKENEILKNKENAPKIGLALSGGGAKGFAHIGALRVLEENNIKIDYITGTSIGALIGTLYSIGYSLDEIEKIVASVEWDKTINILEENKNESLEEKIMENKYNLSLNYDNKLNFKLPQSLGSSQKIYFELKKIFANVEYIDNFDKLPIPVKIIATDLNTGEAKAFTRGDLAKILTASMSIPTIVAPVKIGENHYVDGLLARNFPVEDAFKSGADVVIGIDIGVALNKKEEYNILGVADRIVSIQSANKTKKQQNLATILVSPEIDEFKTTDFDKYEEIGNKGREAMEKQINKVIALNPKTIKSRKIKIDSTTKNEFLINQVSIKTQNIDENHKKIITNIFKKSLNKNLKLDEIKNLMEKVHSLNFINKVYYTIKNNTLNIDFEEKSTNTLGVAVDYETDYGTSFSVGTDINSFGDFGRASRVRATFGDYLGLELSNFSYYGLDNKLGISSEISYKENPFYIYDNTDKIGSYLNHTLRLEVAAVSQYKNLILLSYGFGLNYAELESEIKTNFDSSIGYSKSYGDVFYSIDWNQTNSSNFPTKGYEGKIYQKWGGNVGKDKLNFLQTSYTLSNYTPISEGIIFRTKFYGSDVSGEDILSDKYIKLGGISDSISQNIIAFNGYHFQEKSLSSIVGLRLGIQKKINESLYIGLDYDIATIKYADIDSNENSSRLWENYHQGIGINLNYLTFFGPIKLNLSKAENSKDYLIQMSFGYTFD